MIELGELEGHHQDFDSRHARIVAISRDDQEPAKGTQEKFPHLTIVSDSDQNMAKALQVIAPGAGHEGEDTNAPTTIIVDGAGQVRWVCRPERFITRLSPGELLEAIDKTK